MKEKDSNDLQFDRFIHAELNKLEFPFDPQQWRSLRSQLDLQSNGDVTDFQKSITKKFSWVKWGIVTLGIIQILVILVLLLNSDMLQSFRNDENKSVSPVETPVKESKNNETSYPSKTSGGEKEINKNIIQGQGQQEENKSDVKENKIGIETVNKEDIKPATNKTEKGTPRPDSLMIKPAEKKMQSDSIKKKKYIIW